MNLIHKRGSTLSDHKTLRVITKDNYVVSCESSLGFYTIEVFDISTDKAEQAWFNHPVLCMMVHYSNVRATVLVYDICGNRRVVVFDYVDAIPATMEYDVLCTQHCMIIYDKTVGALFQREDTMIIALRERIICKASLLIIVDDELLVADVRKYILWLLCELERRSPETYCIGCWCHM